MLKQRKGFTLIELMIVIAIIIILAAIAIPNYLNMTERAKKARAASDFDTIATALEAYRTDFGEYPATLTLLSGGVAQEAVASYTLTGEKTPVVYIDAATIEAMKNPWNASEGYTYAKTDEGGWAVYCKMSNNHYFGRTNATSATEVETLPSGWEP